MENEPQWERYTDGIDRVKVDGGFVYRTISQGDVSICFVPEIDLQRYQAHMRDAYQKGYDDAKAEALDKWRQAEAAILKARSETLNNPDLI